MAAALHVGIVLLVLLACAGAQMLPAEVVLRGNASLPCLHAWEAVLNRTFPGWEYLIDATGKSMWDLGKYDQCRDLGPHVAHYCYVQYPMKVGPLPITGANGLCAPAACTDEDLEVALFAFEENTTREESFVHCLPHDSPPLDTGAIIALAAVAVVFAFSIAGTLFDYLTSTPPETEETEPLMGSINDDQHIRHTSEGLRESGLGQFLMCFSVLHNLERLHQPHPDNKTAMLNGLRVLSMFWVILGHSFLYGRANSNHPINFANIMHVFKMEMPTWRFQFVSGAELAVDTFFFLSGFLVTWGALDMLIRTGKLNLLLYYVHRYWRLTPVYAFCIMVFACLEKYMANGPAWFMFDAGCAQWWSNLLYITDFYPTFGKLCFGWGWYLSVDFHFYVFTPIFLFVFYYRPWLGWIMTSLVVLACWIVNAALTYTHNISYYPLSRNFEHDFANKIYNKPWTRMAPYAIGMLFAFYLLDRKHRNLGRVRLPYWLLWLLYACIVLLLWWPVYGTKYLYDTDNSHGGFTKWGNVFYIALARSGWSLGVGLLFLLSYWGYGGIARWILDRPIWTPLARLTYLAYLVHPMVLIPIYGSGRVYHVYSEFWLTSKFAGNVSLAYAVAFVLWLVVEKPTMNLEKFLLPGHGGGRGKKGEH